jgi:hypothetical protein
MATVGQKEISREWPNEEGLIAETTKQTQITNLIPEEDLTPQRIRVGRK